MNENRMLPSARLAFLGLLLLPTTLLSVGARAEEAAAAAKIDSGDTAWMLAATALVLLMTLPGLALFYGGMVRKMNVLATTMQSFAICCLVAILWYVVGYSLAFTNGAGGTSAFIGDLSRLWLKGVTAMTPFTLGEGTENPTVTTIPESVYAMFQMTFAIITPALITGAFAERMKFSALLAFTTLWALFVYAPVAHWVWHPNGFLAGAGVLDYAGGTVVHINAGIAGLIGAILLGKRRGWGHEHIVPHNLVLSLIGASLLWVGWFGFNAGSALTANGRAGMAMLATMLAAASAALAWMFTEWAVQGKPSILGIVSGSVAGLVAVTPASGYVNATGGFLIGIVAGVVCWWGATGLKHKFGYDDSLDAWGVHGLGGIVGAILTGVFATEAVTGDPKIVGLIDGNAHQILLQLEGVAVTLVYGGIASFLLYKLVDLTIGLRVSEEIERQGLDRPLHGETVP
ncbi:MAG: ammonia channel protein [Rhodospirillales bacterium]|nr:ammonia channel protein [Rhodospirillales bacterium]